MRTLSNRIGLPTLVCEVALQVIGDNNVLLSVADKGKGRPKDFDLEKK